MIDVLCSKCINVNWTDVFDVLFLHKQNIATSYDRGTIQECHAHETERERGVK